MKEFKGTGVAMVTPFDKEGNIDVPALKKLTRHMANGKVEFLVILGTTGESATLSESEQYTVIDTILENNGEVPFVLGCGGNNTSAIAAKIGVLTKKYNPDAFLSVSPYYNKPSQEGIYRHFHAVAGATDAPVILYNVPGRTASNMTSDTTLRLAWDCANVVAVKEASGNLEQGMEIIRQRPDNFQVLSGDDILTLPMLGAGYDGVISVVGNAYPLEFSDMVRYALKGDFANAGRIHYSLMKLVQLLFREGNPAGIKSALAGLGIGGPWVRLPLVEASFKLQDDILHELKAIAERV